MLRLHEFFSFHLHQLPDQTLKKHPAYIAMHLSYWSYWSYLSLAK